MFHIVAQDIVKVKSGLDPFLTPSDPFLHSGTLGTSDVRISFVGVPAVPRLPPQIATVPYRRIESSQGKPVLATDCVLANPHVIVDP